MSVLKNNKVVLVPNRGFKSGIIEEISSHLREEGYGSTNVRVYHNKDLIEVENQHFGLISVTFESTNMWSTVERLMGKKYSEVIYPPLCEKSNYWRDISSRIPHMMEFPREIDLLSHHFLFVATKGKYKRFSSGQEDTIKLDTGVEIPLSLIAKTMSYYSDWRKPLNAEFLMALVVEDLNGETDEEIQAIKEVKKLSKKDL